MKIFAALREDTQQGWVWLQDANLRPRSIVRIENLDNRMVVYCEALQIDKNFLSAYNKSPRLTITSPREALVINEWHRSALGCISTQSDVNLNVQPCNSWWGKFKACTDHPQAAIRVAAWLGLISVALGILGVILGALSLRSA